MNSELLLNNTQIGTRMGPILRPQAQYLVCEYEWRTLGSDFDRAFGKIMKLHDFQVFELQITKCQERESGVLCLYMCTRYRA